MNQTNNYRNNHQYLSRKPGYSDEELKIMHNELTYLIKFKIGFASSEQGMYIFEHSVFTITRDDVLLYSLRSHRLAEKLVKIYYKHDKKVIR